MTAWIHPMERRARRYWALQMVSIVVATGGLFVILLLEPTPGRIWGAAAVALTGALLVWGAWRGLKEAIHEYRMHDA
ncbi:hypothetical protein [Arthrobacter sp. zg-Y844]|uniref:hypothetical protein n=1 Tax=Arthrobacter sp. zg-Y844 TaxID=2964612 RepID=UPI002106FFB8|nr:hypothetical protein [Arthrobacter sp. zg-Y844]MCQ1986134.1 hypothetical protein [Arthrobacter sp. zg-Y844]